MLDSDRLKTHLLLEHGTQASCVSRRRKEGCCRSAKLSALRRADKHAGLNSYHAHTLNSSLSATSPLPSFLPLPALSTSPLPPCPHHRTHSSMTLRRAIGHVDDGLWSGSSDSGLASCYIYTPTPPPPPHSHPTMARADYPCLARFFTVFTFRLVRDSAASLQVQPHAGAAHIRAHAAGTRAALYCLCATPCLLYAIAVTARTRLILLHHRYRKYAVYR